MVGGWRGVGSEAELAESGRLGTFRRRHRVAGQRRGCGHCPRRGRHTRSGGERPRLSLWNPGQSPAPALQQPAVGRPFLMPPRAPSSPVVPRGWPDGRAGSDECPLGCQGTSDSAPLGSGGPGVPGSALQRCLRPPPGLRAQIDAHQSPGALRAHGESRHGVQSQPWFPPLNGSGASPPALAQRR